MAHKGFNGNDAALLRIDHRGGTMGWVKSTSFDGMKRNTLILAQAVQILKLSTVLTSCMEGNAQGAASERVSVPNMRDPPQEV